VRGRAVAVLVAAACGAPARRPAPVAVTGRHPERPGLAVLRIEPVAGDAAAAQVAVALTGELRAQVAAPTSRFELAPRKQDDLGELRQLASCPDGNAASCLADIGSYLDVDFLVYGKLERAGDGYALALDLLDVHRRFNRRAEVVRVSADLRGTARGAYEKLGAATGSW